MPVHTSPETRCDHELAATSEEHFGLLVGIAVSRFGISQTDAEALAHEVFLELLIQASRIRDRRAWLIGAIYNASKNHLRRAKRTEPLPDEGPEPADPRYARVGEQWPAELAAREAFACLTPRCQLALRLRYFEGYTVPEMAKILDTTKRYATNLIMRCIEQAKKRYGRRQP